MPELPEVETVRRGLEGAVVGRRIVEVKVLGRRTVRRQSPAELVTRLEGRKFATAGRRGKFLLLSLDDDAVLVVHLRMSGQLLHLSGAQRWPMAPHTHVVVALGDGTELRFVDPRTFGEWFVSSEIDGRGVPLELADLGRDPLLEGLPTAYLAARLAGRRAGLKALLTDQRMIAGIGSIYADEICFRAKLRPDRSGGSLTRARSPLSPRPPGRCSATPWRPGARRCGTCATAISMERSGPFRNVMRSTTGPGNGAGVVEITSSGSRSGRVPPTCAQAASSEPGDGAKPGPFDQSPGSRSGTDNVISTCS